MKTATSTIDSFVLRQEVLGARRFSNYFWALITTMGGVGFLLAGLSSYFQKNLLLVSDPTTLQFIPQGIALLFYGIAGSLLASYIWLTIFWNIGGGYNEFNKQKNQVTVFRWGFAGKNRRIAFTCPLDEIQSIKAEIKEGLNPKRTLYLCTKQRRNIPLTRVGEPIPISDLENQGAELARFLTVPLEGLV